MQVDTNRATGRSTRAVVASVCELLRAHKVIHVSANAQHAKHSYSLAMQWLVDNGWATPEASAVIAIHADPVNLRILFGSGSLHFVPMSANLLGRQATVIKDHYALELEEQERQKQERLDDAATIKALMRKHGWHEVQDIKGKEAVGRRCDESKIVFRT